MNLFLTIYRNKYLKDKIFKEIKNNNKLLKYKRYNYYECPLEVIINNKNESMLLEKVNYYIKYQDDVSIDQLFKYSIDFNLKILKKLILWKELDFEILKLMFTSIKTIKYYMDNKISLDHYKQIYKIIVLGENNNNNNNNNNNIKLLDFIINQFILPKSDQTNVIDWLNILNSSGVDCKYSIEDISLKISKEMFNYLFKNKDDKIRVVIPITERIYSSDSILYKIVLNGIKNQTTGLLNFKVNKSFFKLLEIDYPELPETFKVFINQSIQMNDLEMLKYLISKFPYNKDDELNGTECIKLFNDDKFQISIKKLQQFQIDIENFNSDGTDLFFPFYKILIEKVFKNIGYFTLNQTKPIKINSQDYFNYAMQKLDENRILPNKNIINNQHSNKGIICSHECIRNSVSILLNIDYMDIDYYKSGVLNQNLSKFKIYLSKFQFDMDRLRSAISMGYENMVTYVIQDMISNLNYSQNGKIMSRDEDMLITLFIQSLPNDNVDQNHNYIYELVYPFIKSLMLSVDYQYRTTPYTDIFSTPLPKDPTKRKEFIIKTYKRLHRFNEKRLTYIYSLCRTLASNKKEEMEKLFMLPFCNENKSIIPHSITVHMYFALKNGDYKSIKKINNFTTTNSLALYIPKLLKIYIENNQLKLFFHLILNLGKFQQITTILLITEIVKLCQNYPEFADFIFGLNNFQNYQFFKWLFNSLKNNNNDILINIVINDDNGIVVYQDDVYIDRLKILFLLKLASELNLKKNLHFFNISNDETNLLQLSNHHFYNDYFIKKYVGVFVAEKDPTNQILYFLNIKNKVLKRSHKQNLLKIFGLMGKE